MNPWLSVFAACVCAASVQSAVAARPEIPLWPGKPPGETTQLGDEKDMTKPTDNMIAGKPVIRLGNVSMPTLTFYKASRFKNTGATVVVFPGGGYSILAMDLEGTEVCEWLNSIGVNAVLVKYRVPKRPNVERHVPPLQDAQRAMSLVRERTKEWGIDPQRVGVIGFSAGAHLSAVLSASKERAYSAVDDADKLSSRPDFAMLIYPAYLTSKEQPTTVMKEVEVTTNTPPMFIAMTEDDPVGVHNALGYALALKQVKVPVEVHIYPKGGHGYGLRRTDNPLTWWPDRARDWMKSMKFLDGKH
jgi:acetyl esterase/lipase